MVLKYSLFCLVFAFNWKHNECFDLQSLILGSIKDFNHQVVQHPVLRTLSDLTGDAIATGFRSVSDLQFAVAKLLATDIHIPRLHKSNIAVDFQEDFFKDYNEGTNKEDAYLHITKLVEKYGYKIEKHTVQTEDGYVITMYRMPSSNNEEGTPVMLMHGLLGSADDYVVTGPDHGLAYLLVDQGYDVWLGNARGNVHSKSHMSIPPTESAFWDFSWDEIGRYDLPAMVDYVLITTGRNTLKYIGHSQGTTSFFVMCSVRPEYNKKIDFMAALSPVAWTKDITSPIVRLMAPNSNLIYTSLLNLGLNEFLPNHSLMKTISQIVCPDDSVSQLLCSNILFLTCGFSLEQMNASTLPVILGHTPAGASVKQLAHYGQGIVSEKFQLFDYGIDENIKIYGSESPPEYKMDEITAPVALFYSVKDWFASLSDVDELAMRLPNVIDSYEIPREQFNHIDFLWGVEARELIFSRLIKLMKQ